MSTAQPGSAPEPADIGSAIKALAADVADRLAMLRDELEPTRARWSGIHDYLGPADEWTIAADGLLGPNGVLGMVSDALEITLPDLVAVGWSECASGSSECASGSSAAHRE
ncbi:hypothetical protein ACLQ26_26220 [Micromonospora sp. DT43]|uniref:hypothetical protein n=1 Tax=Micromonospora sp. DT43 TaxID=3393440 RepID=UPI003CF48261